MSCLLSSFQSFLLLFPLSFLLQTILQRFLVTYFTRSLRTICLKDFPITVDVTYLFVAAWMEEGNCQARSHASRPSLILPKAGKIWLQLDSIPDSGSHVSVATDSLPPTPHWAQGGTQDRMYQARGECGSRPGLNCLPFSMDQLAFYADNQYCTEKERWGRSNVGAL